MDCWAARHLGTQYDGNGDWAQGGDINDELLKAWLEDPYFTLPPPKSTGREYFNLEWSNTFRVDDSARNIQATFCKLTVETIARAIERHTKDCHEIYTCGGGTHNTHLMMCLRERLSPLKLRTTDDLGIPPDWVEAVAFAWLAKQTLERKPGNLPLATGAKHPAILGGIYLSGN